ncbi:MAG: hypothetical protein ACREQ5_04505 [Candidatus Dormibacteria bacterium]
MSDTTEYVRCPDDVLQALAVYADVTEGTVSSDNENIEVIVISAIYVEGSEQERDPETIATHRLALCLDRGSAEELFMQLGDVLFGENYDVDFSGIETRKANRG